MDYKVNFRTQQSLLEKTIITSFPCLCVIRKSFFIFVDAVNPDAKWQISSSSAYANKFIKLLKVVCTFLTSLSSAVVLALPISLKTTLSPSVISNPAISWQAWKIAAHSYDVSGHRFTAPLFRLKPMMLPSVYGLFIDLVE